MQGDPRIRSISCSRDRRFYRFRLDGVQSEMLPLTMVMAASEAEHFVMHGGAARDISYIYSWHGPRLLHVLHLGPHIEHGGKQVLTAEEDYFRLPRDAFWDLFAQTEEGETEKVILDRDFWRRWACRVQFDVNSEARKVIEETRRLGLYKATKPDFRNLYRRLRSLGDMGYSYARPGHEVRVCLYKDFAPLSLSFILRDEDGVAFMNGGVIFHGEHDGGGSGGAPTFSVSLTPTSGWSLHT